MMIKDIGISVEELFILYSKEDIISYIEDLYYIHDCLPLERLFEEK